MTKILLIDDDERMIDLYSTIFEDDYEVIVAKDSISALGTAKEALPSIVILDMMMPGQNGLEVLDQLKADPATAEIPVTILSNLTDEKYKKMCLQHGAVKYFVKSDHDPDDLVKEIRKLLPSS